MVISHRGVTVQVKEGTEGCVLQVSNHQERTDAKFPAACREAVTYLLKNAGTIDESKYVR